MEERRRAEEQVQQHQAELAHVARLSTVGEMVVELTHELNQPLSAISSYAQACKRLLCSDGPDDREELLASLNQVGEQADRAAEIIRRLRRFVTKAKPLQTAIDLNALIRDVAELTNIDARMAQAEVRFELTDPLPPVVGDRIQLEQVMVNLMRNAFEAMRDCQPEFRRLTIRTAVDDAQHIGSTCATAASAFRRPRRSRLRPLLHHQAQRHGNGIAHQPVDYRQSRGTLWVTPNSDRGSTFHFTLPIDPGEHSRGS